MHFVQSAKAHRVTVCWKLLVFLSNPLPGTSGVLSASQSKCRTSPTTCHFPKFLKLQGIHVCPSHRLGVAHWMNTGLFLGLHEQPPVGQVQNGSERWILQDLASCNCHILFSIGDYSIQNWEICNIHLSFSTYSWHLFSCIKWQWFSLGLLHFFLK